jgi:Zn-finger nucleic acid-binding protein
MICPECNAKIGQKNFDTELEMYECPSCEAIFTGAELANGHVKEEAKAAVKKVAAKGKKRQSEIHADEEAIAQFEKEQFVVRKSEKAVHHRDEILTVEVVNIMADELQSIYQEMGGQLDDINAHDKALTLWRHVHIHDGITAREKDVPHVFCDRHAE